MTCCCPYSACAAVSCFREVADIAADLDSVLDCELFDMLSQSSSDIYFYVSDISSGRSRWSAAAVEEFDLKDEYQDGADWLWLCRIHPEDQPIFLRDLEQMLTGQNGDVHHCEYRVKNKAGQYVWIRSRGVLRRNSDGSAALFTGVLRNMGLNPKYDTNTNLYTIHEFRARLYETLSQPGQRGGILLFGIDDFSRINDVHDYAFGNLVLRAFAEKLLSLHLPGFLFRMDGDKFAYWMQDAEAEDLEVVFSRYSAVAAELTVGEEEIPLVLTGGYVLYPSDGIRAEDLHRRLEVALNTAKLSEPGGLCAFSSEMFRDEQRLDALRAAIHRCVENNFEGFYLLYQPQIYAMSRTCPAAEAILCWSSEEYPNVSHTELMAALEESGDILRLGHWALEQALTQVKQWQKTVPSFGISMDICSRQIVQRSFIDRICQLAAKHALPNGTLCLELNDGCYAAGSRHLYELTATLRKAGIMTALDGFAPEHLTLSLLKDIRPQWIKILPHHVFDSSSEEPSILPSLFALFHQLGMYVCAEALESSEPADIAIRAGADFVQGPLYSPPLDADTFYERFISEQA